MTRTTASARLAHSGLISTAVLLVLLGCALATGCEGDPCAAQGSLSAWADCVHAQPASNPNDETCCGGQGWCFQSSILPASQVEQLVADACPAVGQVCVPKELAVPAFVPTHCRSLGDVEGRCLSECLPFVSARSAMLPQSNCESASRCVPCFDPVTGGQTGACSLSSDDAPGGPPAVFPSCCGGVGRCVPPDLLTATQASQVERESCKATTDRCVPQSLIGATSPPPTCLSVAGAEGRCLSTCLPLVSKQASQLPQSSCDAGTLCAPCFDAVTGKATGACSITPDDHPMKLPTVFPMCCGGVGRCVPQEELADAQKSEVARDTCASDTDLCVPNAMLVSGYVPPTCKSIDSAEGRCLSTCLPLVSKQASQLPQSSCDAGTLCAPCFDPVTGSATGACTTSPNDHPAQLATVFPTCCGGVGRCVPQGQLTDAQKGEVERDSCAAATDLCVPEAMIATDYVPPTCRSVGNGEGRCLSTCLPLVSSQASLLPRSSCADGNLCTPCFNPITGAATGACSTSPQDSPKEPPYVFPTCCRDGTNPRGTCVPAGEVTASQAANLSADTCSGSALCAPTKKLLNASYAFPACVFSLTGGPGACLPDCLPATQGANGQFLTSFGCQSREKCVPCTNPSTGAPTGACN